MSLSVVVVSPSDGTTETAYTTKLRALPPEGNMELGGKAFFGEADGEGTLTIDDDAGTIVNRNDLAAGRRIIVREDASGTAVALHVGRIGPRTQQRDLYEMDRGRSITVNTIDANIDLEGIVVDRWSRPAETPAARVAALRTAYLAGTASTRIDPDGNPWGRASTSIGTAYVNATGTATMPAQEYVETDPRDVLRDCADWAGYDFFVTPNNNGSLELFFDDATGTAFTSTLSMSDNPSDTSNGSSTTCYAPIWDMGPAHELDPTQTGQASGLLLISADEKRTYDSRGTAVTNVNDKWEYPDRTDATVQADINNDLVARLNRRQEEGLTVQFSIKVRADKVHLVRPGHRFEVKRAYAAGIGTSTYFRVVQCRYIPIAPDWYHIALVLGFPIKLVPRRSSARTVPRAPFPGGPPTLVSSSVGTTGGTSIQVNSGLVDSALIIAVQGHNGQPTSVSWSLGGTATLVSSTGSSPWFGLYYLLNPTPGGSPGTLTMSGASGWIGCWLLQNVNQTTPIASSTFASGTGTVSAVSFTPAANTFVVDSVDVYNADGVDEDENLFTLTATGGQTQDWNQKFEAGFPGFADIYFGGGHGDSSPGWTFDQSQPWRAFVAAVAGIEGEDVGTVGGTGEGTVGTSGSYIPTGSVLEHNNITTGGPYHEAADVTIADAGAYFTGTTVEAALQEAGADIAALGGGVALNDLTDVTITSPVDLHHLIYDATAAQWKNSAGFWRPLMDGAGAVITDGATGEAIMAFQ